MALTDELKSRTAPLWERMVTHPFVAELGDGTLPLDKFRAYFIQDYVFVKDLAKVVSMAMAKAPSLEAAGHFSQFLDALLTSEENLFKRAFKELDIPPEQYRHSRAAPTTAAFGDFLVRLAYEGTFEEMVTAMYVTEGTYLDWATRLIGAKKRPQNRLYQEWIDIHSPQVLGDIVAWMGGYINSGDFLTPPSRLEEIFLTALRYELLFWEMAYKGEGWPDE